MFAKYYITSSNIRCYCNVNQTKIWCPLCLWWRHLSRSVEYFKNEVEIGLASWPNDDVCATKPQNEPIKLNEARSQTVR